MPPHIKIILSIVVIGICGAGHIWRDTIGLQASGLFLGGFATFMVMALWLFPESRRGTSSRR